MAGLGAPTSRPSGSVAAQDGAPGWIGPFDRPSNQGPEYCEGPLADTLAGKGAFGNYFRLVDGPGVVPRDCPGMCLRDGRPMGIRQKYLSGVSCVSADLVVYQWRVSCVCVGVSCVGARR